MKRGEWSKGPEKNGFSYALAVMVMVYLLIGCQFDETRQKKLAADQATALEAVLKRNKAIADYIPSLSEWIKNGSLEGKQLRKPYPTLDEMAKLISPPDYPESIAAPGKPASVMTALWYYGPGRKRSDLALEAEFLEEGGTWRLIDISFWRGKDASANTMEYIGRDVMFWKETRYNKR